MSAPGPAASEVAHWTFDDAAGRIAAFDRDGRLLMVIAASPLFGARLAAAFCGGAPQARVFGAAASWPQVMALAQGHEPAGGARLEAPARAASIAP